VPPQRRATDIEDRPAGEKHQECGRKKRAGDLYPGRHVTDRLIDRWTWQSLVGIWQYRAQLGKLVEQWCEFAAFHAEEDGSLPDIPRLAFLSGERHGVREQRWYDHRNRAEELGLVRQHSRAFEDHQAEWRLSFPAELLERGALLSPGSLPDDLAEHLGFHDLYGLDIEDEEFLDGFLQPRNTDEVFEVEREYGVTRTPPADLDAAAAARAKLLTLDPWLTEEFAVAAALRLERDLFERVGSPELFDVEAAEARVRRQLRYEEREVRDDSLDYIEAVADALFDADREAVPEDETMEENPQLTGRQEQLPGVDPETSPNSRERVSSISYVAVRKYWREFRDEEKPKIAATARVGPAERRSAASLLRRYVWSDWVEWQETHGGSLLPPISKGQWEDITTAVAYALRRTTPGMVIALCTEGLDSARDLLPVVAHRLWLLIRSVEQYPEWDQLRRNAMHAAAPDWNLPIPRSVIGPASARAEVDRREGRTPEVWRQLKIGFRPPAAAPDKHAERARNSVMTGSLESKIRKAAGAAQATPTKLTEAEHQAIQENVRTSASSLDRIRRRAADILAQFETAT
jgi:hypothetical protein